MTDKKNSIAPAAPLRPEERMNEYSAQSEDQGQAIGEMIEYGPASEADARASGYTDESGHAVEMAKSHDGTHLATPAQRDSHR